MPPPTCGGGVFVCGDGLGGRGRIGPFGAAEVREGEVGFFLGHEVGVGSECELGLLVPELIGDPSEALAGSEGGARVGVMFVWPANASVQRWRTNADRCNRLLASHLSMTE